MSMSALGQKQTFRNAIAMSALPPKADIRRKVFDVCFVPEADISKEKKDGRIKNDDDVGRAVEIALSGLLMPVA